MMGRMMRAGAVGALALGWMGCSKSNSSAADAGAAATGAPKEGPSALAFLNGFEGEISLLIQQTAKGPAAPNVPLSLQIRGDKVRADMPQGIGGPSRSAQAAPKGAMIFDSTAKKFYMVMDEQKQVMVIDLGQAGAQLPSFGARAGAPGGGAKQDRPSSPPPKLTKTGVTDKVAGYTCENWDVADATHKVATLCIADQGASWFHLPTTAFSSDYAWATELMDGKHFPLRAVGYGKEGAEDGRVEVSKIEKKPVPPSVFEIPAGYKVVDLAAMMQAGLGMGAPRMPPNFPPGTMPQLGQLPKKPR